MGADEVDAREATDQGGEGRRPGKEAGGGAEDLVGADEGVEDHGEPHPVGLPDALRHLEHVEGAAAAEVDGLGEGTEFQAAGAGPSEALQFLLEPRQFGVGGAQGGERRVVGVKFQRSPVGLGDAVAVGGEEQQAAVHAGGCGGSEERLGGQPFAHQAEVEVQGAEGFTVPFDVVDHRGGEEVAVGVDDAAHGQSVHEPGGLLPQGW